MKESEKAKNLSPTLESVKILKGNVPETLDIIDDSGR
jgi:hypothetical protein